MKLHLALLLSLLVPLNGCSRTPAPAPAPAAQTATTVATPATAVAPAPSSAATVTTPASAPTPAEPAPAEPAPTPAVATTGAAPKGVTEGTDYTLIPDGTPLEPGKAKVEVVEFFNYICPACNAFNPELQQWKAKQGPDVRVVYVPADFRADFVAYARAYYAAEALNLVDKTHEAVYKAIHETHQLPAEGSVPDEGKIAAFYAGYGTSASVFQGTMHSFAVDAKLRKGHDFMVKSKVQGTPALVINGRYLVKGRNFADDLRIADALIASERGAH